MRPSFFTQGLVPLLAGVMAMAVFAKDSEAATPHQRAPNRAVTTAKIPCSRSDVRCLRKGSKPVSAKTKTETDKNKKQPTAKRAAKPVAKPRVAKATRVPKDIRLAVRPKRKPILPKPVLPEPPKPSFLPEIVQDVPKPPAAPAAEAKVNPPVYGDACRDELAQLGADFSVTADIKGTGVCHITNPVQLRSVMTSVGRVVLPGTPLLNCAFAQQFVTWLFDVAAPLVAGAAGAKLSSLSTGASYQCRARNGDLSGKMSEHAFGNAVDIGGITLTNNRRIEITAASDPQDPDGRLLAALRASACGYFSTVLGPGSDAAHASYSHFDLGIHGNSDKYRICE
jgi:hypothetical protein